MYSDTVRGRWTQIRGRAKETRGQLTDDKPLRMGGIAQRSSVLIQERHGVTREDVERPVDRLREAANQHLARHWAATMQGES